MRFTIAVLTTLAALVSAGPTLKRQTAAACPEADAIPVCGVSHTTITAPFSTPHLPSRTLPSSHSPLIPSPPLTLLPPRDSD